MPGDLAGYIVAHVLATAGHGGAERVVLDLARRQRERGADVRVICLQQLGDLLPAFGAAGVPVSLLDGAGHQGPLRAAWRLAKLLRETKATVVHTHNSAPQITVGLASKLQRWPRLATALVHTEHGRLGDIRPTLLRLRRWTAREFDVIIAVSGDARTQLLERGIRTPEGVEVVRNGVDVTRFSERPPRSVNSVARIVHVGRLDQIKGQDVLLAAMPAIRAAIPAARLTIVGDGPTRRRLEDQAERLGILDVVGFSGAADDVRPFLMAADLFVLPSRSEGISLALLEAMATGLPVVATDVGGNREVISAGSGTLVPPEQPDRLAASIVELLQDPDLAAAKGTAGRRTVEERFASDDMVTAYALLYHRAHASHTPARTRSAA